MLNNKKLFASSFVKCFAASLVFASGSQAQAQTDIDYERRILELEKQIEEIKKYQSNVDKKSESESVEYVRAGTTPGSFVVPGTNTELVFDGFVHFQAAAGENGSGLPSEAIFAPFLVNSPFGDVEGKDTALEASIRRSRLSLTSYTPGEGADLKTHIEIDFAGGKDSESFLNGHDLRIRRAFANYGNWLVGQEFSTFLDFASLGELVNFGSHTNAIFIRQPQVRYTSKYDWGGWMLAAENAFENSVVTISGNVDDTDQDDQTFPDLVARVDYNFGKTHTSAKVLARQLKLDTVNQGDDSQWAGALSLTARFPVFGDSLGVQYNYGALGRYLGVGPYPDAYVEDGQIESFDVWGASAVYSHRWGGKWNWRSTLSLAYTEADENLDNFAVNTIDSASSVHINLMWNPGVNTKLGVEYGRFGVETGAGVESDLNRVHFMAQYDF